MKVTVEPLQGAGQTIGETTQGIMFRLPRSLSPGRLYVVPSRVHTDGKYWCPSVTHPGSGSVKILSPDCFIEMLRINSIGAEVVVGDPT